MEPKLAASKKSQKTITQYSGQIVDTIKIGSLESIVVAVSKNRVSSLAGQLQQSGFTRYVELNVQCHNDAIPSDVNYTAQWGLQKIGADYAWNTTAGNHSILAAIIDPIDYNHPDLAPNYVPLGWDWGENDSYPMDTSGHGTHCAGILAAVTNNSIGIAGVAQVRIMAEDWTGNAEIGGWIGGLAKSLIHATDAGANIISCSAGTYYESDLIREAANYATSHGVLVFASAGNYGMNIRWYPAAYDGVEAVASTDINDTVASSSNYCDFVDCAAPGVSIYSTLPNNNYGYMSGTPMACPMAVGVAALIWSQYPNMSAEGIRYQLERTCKDLGDPGYDIHYGNGRVDARNAIETPYPIHELIVKTNSANSGSSLTAPGLQVGQTRQINATVYNCGLSNETNVVLSILIDGTIVHSEVIPNFASGASYKCQYNWAPTADAVYNVTIATSHLQGETSYANNVVESLIGVSAKVALIDDGGSVGAYLVPLLDAMYVNYDLYKSNYGYYTGNLTLLQSYNAVIFYKTSRNITEAEQTALNSYLASGGSLLVAAGNALSSTVDLRLADVIRSLPSSIKTNQSDLYSASSTHPIMNGPFGVFPAGFRIRNVATEYGTFTDLVYANTSRGAKAVATTGDGGAKILATDSLPGKVVFWNGNVDNWLIDDCRTIFKNIVAWLTDNVPPATTNDYDGNWHNENFTINLKASDYFAVKETYYRINGGETRTLSADGQPKITSESANGTLEYWSIDYSRNQENHHSLTQNKTGQNRPDSKRGQQQSDNLR